MILINMVYGGVLILITGIRMFQDILNRVNMWECCGKHDVMDGEMAWVLEMRETETLMTRFQRPRVGPLIIHNFAPNNPVPEIQGVIWVMFYFASGFVVGGDIVWCVYGNGSMIGMEEGGR